LRQSEGLSRTEQAALAPLVKIHLQTFSAPLETVYVYQQVGNRIKFTHAHSVLQPHPDSMQTISLDITMNAHQSSIMRPGKIESLKTEHDYLHLLRARHLQWRSDANDPEIRRMHGEIVDSIQPIIDQSEILINTLQK
jgi:hypothetical protein